MRGISIKAVLVAFVVMLALDVVVSVVLTLSFGWELFGQELGEQQLVEALMALTMTQSFLVWGLIFGTLTTVAGGYIAARMAQRVPYMNALAFGVLGIVVGVLMSEGLPLWYNVLGFGLVVPAALFGAYIFKRGHGGPPGTSTGS